MYEKINLVEQSEMVNYIGNGNILISWILVKLVLDD